MSQGRSLREGGESNNVAEEDYDMLVRLRNELLAILQHAADQSYSPNAFSPLQPDRPAATVQFIAE